MNTPGALVAMARPTGHRRVPPPFGRILISGILYFKAQIFLHVRRVNPHVSEAHCGYTSAEWTFTFL